MHKRVRNGISKVYQKMRSAVVRFLFSNLKPISDIYGFDRGTPIDRHYIESFLGKNGALIRGRCLEILDDGYIRKFGTPDKTDILDIDRDNKKANIHADLRNMPEIPDNEYDCIILTQVLQFIDDYEAAIKECRRILKPGGVLLATLPSLSRMDVAAGVGGDFWRWTPTGAKHVFGKYFDREKLEVRGYGNVLSGTGFWIGMAKHEISKRKLDYADPHFPILAAVKAEK